MSFLRANPFSPPELLEAFERGIGNAGAVVSFSGYVRAENRDETVASLFLQHHPTLTEDGIEAAIQQARARWSLTATMVCHRIGEVKAGAPIVFVAAASRHRRAAFEAADFLMDYLKTEAVFWKKEVTQTGSVWIEPREEDYVDRARWSSQKRG